MRQVTGLSSLDDNICVFLLKKEQLVVYGTEPTLFKASRQIFDSDLLQIVGIYLLTYLLDLI